MFHLRTVYKDVGDKNDEHDSDVDDDVDDDDDHDQYSERTWFFNK